MLRRRLYGALAGLLLVVLGACTNTGSGAASTTTSRVSPTTSTPTTAPESTTVTTVPAVLASSTPGVKRFLASVNSGGDSTFIATYRETQKLKHGGLMTSTVVVAWRSPERWSVSYPDLRIFNLKSGLKSGLYQCGLLSGTWNCRECGCAMGGYSALTISENPVNGLFFQLYNGLYQTPLSSVHLTPRTLDGTRLTCLAISSGDSAGDTWCILPTGQLAYFLSDSGMSQIGAQRLVMTRISKAVPASAFVLPAVASSTSVTSQVSEPPGRKDFEKRA